LSGSYGAALQDEYSDIDFLLATAGGASDEVAEIWHKAIRRIGEIVLWRDRQVGPALVNVITEAWLRIDVVILKPEQMAAHTKDKIRVLFDHGGIYERLSENAECPSPDLRRAGYQFEEFIRILGLLAIAAGREEYINGVTGVFHLRNLLVDPLVQETAAPYRGGALHLNRLITDEQKELLTSLPPAVATRGALIDAHLAYAQAYLPRARRLARAWGVEWPERFEAATWKQLHETLSIQPPHQLGDPQPLRT
jgi:hypothetical protein